MNIQKNIDSSKKTFSGRFRSKFADSEYNSFILNSLKIDSALYKEYQINSQICVFPNLAKYHTY